MVRTKTNTSTITKVMPPPPPKDQVDMDYEELIKQLEEENAQLRKESKYWEEEALKFMARLTEVIYWYEGDVENVFGEEGGTEECKRDDVALVFGEEEEDDEEGDDEEEGDDDEEEDTWREWWEETGEDWKKWWDMGVKKLEW